MNYLIICNDVSVDSHAFSRFEDDKYLFFSSFVFFLVSYFFLLSNYWACIFRLLFNNDECILLSCSP